MKILCICHAGVVRSVALAMVFRNQMGQDALACSADRNSEGTLEMLASWAELIFYVEPRLVEAVPEIHRGKSVLINLGPDQWGTPQHPELRERIHQALMQAGFAMRESKPLPSFGERLEGIINQVSAQIGGSTLPPKKREEYLQALGLCRGKTRKDLLQWSSSPDRNALAEQHAQLRTMVDAVLSEVDREPPLLPGPALLQFSRP